ncbi:hypothetical protein PV08_11305 [Exophiala spinifera]|uniref:Uncharacterized protein n=1 Tax=Exophiala spinifera TaxID=91928 RepID=A0A0D2AUC7_9EURO|nr:uncharacterized protein PV08_11305 [Exophiala spinifera]KIW10343.1 hypothetical protein PV08_11305 [Exophiala spinifera]
MVFNPTSPIRVFGRKVANPPRPVAAEPNIRSTPTTTELPHPASPALTMGSSWHEGMSRLRHPSRDGDATLQETSRWSKTTTESEASEALKNLQSQPRNVLRKKTKQNRKSTDTTNSSPVDPSYDPTAKRFLEMPPGSITDPDESKSSYDSGSDDSGQESPVIQRASSVRVAKPNIVQHNNNSGWSIPRLYAPRSTPTEIECSTAKDLSPSKGHGLCPSVTGQESLQGGNLNGPEDALKAPEGRVSEADTLTALPEVISLDHRPEQSNHVKETIIEFPDTPGRVEALSTLPTPMGGFGSVRLPRNETGTISSSGTFVSTAAPIDGLRSNPPTDLEKKLSRAISAPVRNSRRVTIRPADLIITQTNNDHKLFRENVVSTPYPARHSSIGEIDEVAAANVGDGDVSRADSKTSSKLSKSLRRARSTRRKSLSTSQEAKGEITEKPRSSKTLSGRLLEKDEAPEIPLSTKPAVGASTPTTSDRFPSPVGPEVLFLDLHLARQPSAKTTVEIVITDKTSFDDEQLFAVVQQSYRSHLLGVARRLFSARELSYASPSTDFSASTTAASTATPAHRFWYPGSPLPPLTPAGGGAGGKHDIDGTDFVKHLRNPRLGRRRKLWLLWLRNGQQQTESFASRRPRTTRHAPGPADTSSPSDDVSPVFSFMGHSRNNSRDSDAYGTATPGAFAFGSSGATAAGATTTTTTTPSAHPSVKTPRMPFHAPTFPMSYRGGSRSHFGAGASSRDSSTGATTSGPPCLYLHHTFSLRRIVAALAVVLFLAIFTTVTWVLFGLPGRGADQGDTTTLVEGVEYVVGWKRDAQSRAGVGLLMGIAVLLGGLACEAVWVWGSWVLI